MVLVSFERGAVAHGLDQYALELALDFGIFFHGAFDGEVSAFFEIDNGTIARFALVGADE